MIREFFNQLFTKKIYDVVRYGIQGRPQYPPVSPKTLVRWYRRNEIAFACVQKISQCAVDPELILERRSKSGDWQREEGHALLRLMMRPNSYQDGPAFISSWLVSEHVFGVFYAEIVRSRAGAPVQLWPLDASKLAPVAGDGKNGEVIAAYEWRDGGEGIRIPAKDVLVSRLEDPANRFQGLAPLQVALGSIDADSAQTDYVRAFFDNGGVPSGLLKLKGQVLKREKADEIRARWEQNYGRGGRHFNSVAVLDENADYQQIGSNIQQIESQQLRIAVEARICGAFGVPPLLVSALVGLAFVNQRSSARESQAEFWANKMSPTFKRIRNFLMWTLLVEFEPVEELYSNRVRLNWDMSQVAALQEILNERDARVRENFKAGLIPRSRAQALIGEKPDAGGDYYVDLSKPPQSQPDKQKGSKSRALPPESKVFTWEGIECWREPTESEIKANLYKVGHLQQQGKDDLSEILSFARQALIADAVRELAKLDAGNYHTLVLKTPYSSLAKVKDLLSDYCLFGAQSFRSELSRLEKSFNQSVESKSVSRVETIAQAAITAVVNDVQARTASIASHLAMVVTDKEALLKQVEQQLKDSSDSVVTRSAAGAVNSAIALGRKDVQSAYEAASDSQAQWLYSSILDGKTCRGYPESCATKDGQTASSVDDLPICPNPFCGNGFGRCRCAIILL